jgi:hypothetical protein
MRPKHSTSLSHSMLHPAACLLEYMQATQTMEVTSDKAGDSFQLLNLPGPALKLALQQLDQCSLASAAASCSSLRDAAPASITDLTAQVGDSAEKYESLCLWLERHSSSLAGVKKCSILGASALDGALQQPYLRHLPCQQLRQLSLPQLPTPYSLPGVLLACTALAALELKHCVFDSSPSAVPAAAAAADRPDSSRLQSLAALHSLVWDAVEVCQMSVLGSATVYLAVVPDLQPLTQLTKLHISVEQFEQLRPLSALVGLGDLAISVEDLSPGVQGGLPCQLVNLTALRMSLGTHDRAGPQAAEAFQHLHSFTALRQLEVTSVRRSAALAEALSGIQHLSQLTGLILGLSGLLFDVPSTSRWAQLTALERLELSDCRVQPEALAAFTQLRALSVQGVPWALLQTLSWQSPTRSS